MGVGFLPWLAGWERHHAQGIRTRDGHAPGAAQVCLSVTRVPLQLLTVIPLTSPRGAVGLVLSSPEGGKTRLRVRAAQFLLFLPAQLGATCGESIKFLWEKVVLSKGLQTSLSCRWTSLCETGDPVRALQGRPGRKPSISWLISNGHDEWTEGG